MSLSTAQITAQPDRLLASDARASAVAIRAATRQPLAPGSRMAMRATSLLNSVTYIERSAAKALPPVTGLSSTAMTKPAEDRS